MADNFTTLIFAEPDDIPSTLFSASSEVTPVPPLATGKVPEVILRKKIIYFGFCEIPIIMVMPIK